MNFVDFARFSDYSLRLLETIGKVQEKKRGKKENQQEAENNLLPFLSVFSPLIYHDERKKGGGGEGGGRLQELSQHPRVGDSDSITA